MALKVTPQQFAEKWARRTTAASPDYQAGVQRVTVSPGQQAAAQSALWLQKVTSAEAKFKANAGAVDLSTWKEKTANIGGARLAQGVQGAQNKMADVANRLLPAIEAARAKVMTMPRGDLEANIARAATFAREMAKSKIK